MSVPDLRTPIRLFGSLNGEPHLCEACAVRRYKERYPLTWDLAPRKGE